MKFVYRSDAQYRLNTCATTNERLEPEMGGSVLVGNIAAKHSLPILFINFEFIRVSLHGTKIIQVKLTFDRLNPFPCSMDGRKISREKPKFYKLDNPSYFKLVYLRIENSNLLYCFHSPKFVNPMSAIPTY
jgi:hypothetical protein